MTSKKKQAARTLSELEASGGKPASSLTWTLAVLTLALIVRLLHLLSYQSTPLAEHLVLDPHFYLDVALAILNGDSLDAALISKAPLYPYFLAALLAVFEQSLLAVRLAQIALGSLSCVMVYLLARRFYSNKVAVTAGVAAALYGPFIMFEVELLLPSLIVFFDLLSLLLLFRYEDSRNRWLLFLSGLILGLSALARPNILILAPGVIVWLYRYCRLRRKRPGRDSLIYLLGILVMLAVLVVRNHSVTGEFSLFGNYGGYNFLIGNNPAADGKTAILPGTSAAFDRGFADAAAIASRTAGRELATAELGGYWLKMGFDYITDDPGGWLWLEVKKLVFLISGYEIPSNRTGYFFAKMSPVLRPLLWDKVISFPFGLILPLALAGVFAGQVRRNQFPLTFMVVAYSAAILPFFVIGRFRLPVVPILLIWAAAGAWSLWFSYRRHDRKLLTRLILVFLVSLLLSNGLTHLSAFAVRPPDEHQSHLFLGEACYETGRLDEAEAELQEAARLNPLLPRTYRMLGKTYEDMGEDSIAATYYRRYIEVDPNYVNYHQVRLESMHQRENRIVDFYDMLRAHLLKSPASHWALKDYAAVHVLLKEYRRAAELYGQAYDADNSDLQSLERQAELLIETKSWAAVEAVYRRLLDKEPNSVNYRNALGEVYARQNRLNEAVAEFEWVRECDPDNQAAHFNLATAYYHMGRVAQARNMLKELERLNPSFPGLTSLQKLIDSAN